MELHEILIYGVAALGCFILAILIKGNRQAVLQLATDLINKAESTIKVPAWARTRRLWSSPSCRLPASRLHPGWITRLM